MRKMCVFIILLVCCVKAVCCDCARGIISVNDFNSHDWVFIGTLLREKSPQNYSPRKCIYKVNKAYKGVVKGDTVEVCDNGDVAACGLGKMTIGADYLIYAGGDEEKWTSRCIGNTRVPFLILPRDSAIINNLRAGRNRGGMDDTINTTFHSDTLFLNTHVSKVSGNVTQKFYDKTGKISAKGRYKNGLPDGLWQYFENGKLVEHGKYLNGKKDSLWVRQYAESKNIEEFRNGVYTYRQTTFYNNKIYSQEMPAAKGKKWISSVYHDNGRPRFVAYANPPKRDEHGRLRRPVWNGPFRTFNKSGILLDEGLYKDGISTGHWTYYYPDGRLRMEGSYADGKKTGIWKIYYPDKKIKATGGYDHDEKTGEWKFYDKTGKKIQSDPELIKDDEDWFTYVGY